MIPTLKDQIPKRWEERDDSGIIFIIIGTNRDLNVNSRKCGIIEAIGYPEG